MYRYFIFHFFLYGTQLRFKFIWAYRHFTIRMIHRKGWWTDKAEYNREKDESVKESINHNKNKDLKQNSVIKCGFIYNPSNRTENRKKYRFHTLKKVVKT